MNENVNIPLLRKAVEWAEVEAAKPAAECMWDQNSWITTPESRAGRINDVVEYGYDETSYDNIPNVTDMVEPEDCGTCFCIAGYLAEMNGIYVANASGDVIAEYALKALGVETNEGATHFPLFAAGNTIEEVRALAEEIAGERL